MLQVKSAQKRQTAIPLKRRNPVDGTLVIILIMLLLAGLLVLFSATFYTGTSTRSPYSEVLKQLLGIGLLAASVCRGGRIGALRGAAGAGHHTGRWRVYQRFAAVAVAGWIVLPAVRNREIRRGAVYGDDADLPRRAHPPSLHGHCASAGRAGRHILLMLIGGLGVGAFYAWSEPYRRRRLLSFRNPFSMMSDEGYQLSQSLIAFGSGGIFGMGLGMGRQKYAYLPYPESDFIFAIVGEDFGLLGCLIVVALFVALMLRGMRIAMRCPDKFGTLLAAGITSSISVQAFLNMGVVVGILPTTGLPLPFFSAGGTSISITMAAIGILLNISRESAI